MTLMTTIRPELPADCHGIHDVHLASFPTTSEARLVDALRAGGRLSGSLVASDQHAIIGHVAFSPLLVSSVTAGACLGPLAVLPGYRRQGIAGELVRRGLELCERAAVGFVVVLGNPNYYQRFGFQPARNWKLRDEYNGGDAFQAMELIRGSIQMGAVLRHAPEFAAMGV